MPAFLTVRGTQERYPLIQVKLAETFEDAALACTQVHEDHAEIGPWGNCIKLDKPTMAAMAPSLVYAAHLLLHSAAPPGTSPLGIVSTDLSVLTLAVERELRMFRPMAESEFTYRLNVHSRFTVSGAKGSTTRKTMEDDDSGSKILLMGPFASNIPGAMAALEAELVRKIEDRMAKPAKGRDGMWMLDPFPGENGEPGDGGPPGPIATWAGLNVRVMRKEEVDEIERVNEEEIGCEGGFTQWF